MMRGSKVFWILILSLSLIPITGESSLLMASSSQSHSTHFDSVRGPGLPLNGSGCYVCHAAGDEQCQSIPLFADDGFLETTHVCDSCHSPNGAFDGVGDLDPGNPYSVAFGAKYNWDAGVYEPDGATLKAGKELWCVTCHDGDAADVENLPANSEADGSGIWAPNISGDNTTFGYYVNGHRSELCSDCHDLTTIHIDGEARTYAYAFAQYAPDQSGVAYAQGYRLKSMDADVPGGYNESVPLMIPTNFGTTFGYVGQDIMDNAFRLCFDCHDSNEVLDDTAGDTSFKASLPNPPRDYSYGWSDAGDANQHVVHVIGQTMQSWDSDWDTGTTGPGPGPGYDTQMTCSSCHNVHGAAGADGSTNEPMIRDGSLADRTGYGFSYVIKENATPWPPEPDGDTMVTSANAFLPNSVGAIFRNGNAMCSGLCHQSPARPATSYNATGTGPGTYLEYYRAPAAATCDICHAQEASHPTHDDSTGKGVDLACKDCHDLESHGTGNVVFADGSPLSTTNACDSCHSSGGAYAGVSMAKDNWVDGIYEPDGVTFQLGKDQWCAGCHDDGPANSKADGTGIWAPEVMGDSAQTYGYNISGHGRPSANLTCDVCHDLTKTHIDHDPRTYDVNESSRVGNDINAYAGHGYKAGYRLEIVMTTTSTSALIAIKQSWEPRPITWMDPVEWITSTQPIYTDMLLLIGAGIQMPTVWCLVPGPAIHL